MYSKYSYNSLDFYFFYFWQNLRKTEKLFFLAYNTSKYKYYNLRDIYPFFTKRRINMYKLNYTNKHNLMRKERQQTLYNMQITKL